jgi:enoyl-[acyl-carrier protein] reductase III
MIPKIVPKKSLAGKIAVVTGGTRGIGRAVSIQLAREGARVLALFARDKAAAQDLMTAAQNEGLDIQTVRGDLTHDVKFAEVVTQIESLAASSNGPQIDILVHCAASGVHRNAMELTLKHMNWTFDVNVFAIHRLIQALIDKMPRGSRIIGLTSSGGTRVIPYYAAVGASKGALESLFRHYAYELAPRGIAVNSVCPGLVLTDAIDAFPDTEQRTQKALQTTPTGRLTTPEDVAHVVQFLCHELSAQIVGQTLVIDGGKTLLS